MRSAGFLASILLALACGCEGVDSADKGGQQTTPGSASDPRVDGATCGDAVTMTFTWTGGTADLEITSGALTGTATATGVASGYSTTLPAGDYVWQILPLRDSSNPSSGVTGPGFSITAPPSPEPIPVSDLWESPVSSGPPWTTDLTWVEPTPAPAS